jgi:hypothetical protein
VPAKALRTSARVSTGPTRPRLARVSRDAVHGGPLEAHGSIHEVPRTIDMQGRPPADRTRVMEMIPAASGGGGNRWQKGAGGSSSHRPGASGVPELAMRCAMMHHNIWEEFYQVGLDLQNSLHRSQTLHSNDGLRLFQVYVLGPLPFFRPCLIYTLPFVSIASAYRRRLGRRSLISPNCTLILRM